MMRLRFACLLAGALCGTVNAQAARAVKLEVIGPEKSVGLGERATVKIELRDANNRPAPAPKVLQVDLQMRLPSGAEEKAGSVTLAAGQSSVSFTLPSAKTEGFVYVVAQQKELRPGGAYVLVKGFPRTTAIAELSQDLAAAATKSLEPAPGGAKGATAAKVMAKQPISAVSAIKARPRILPARIPVGIAVVPNGGIEKQPEAKQSPAPAPTEPPKPAVPPPAEAPKPPPARYELALRYSPQRPFLANGKDPSTVHAFVISDDGAPLPGFRVNLFDGSGRLTPSQVIIPPGAEEGRATLAYDHIGDVKVEYLSSMPSVTVDGDPSMSIRFDPPITGFTLEAKPISISFVDTSDLVVTLVNDDQQAISTSNPLTASLSIDSGRGELSEHEVTIDKGRSDARVQITPSWWGQVTVSATIPNLPGPREPVKVQVNPPYGLLGLAILGGLVGGLVFVLRHPKAPRWRIPVGALTGTMLVWAALVLRPSALPRTAVLNPIGIVMLAALGGWLGTELFEPLLKRIVPGSGAAAEEK